MNGTRHTTAGTPKRVMNSVVPLGLGVTGITKRRGKKFGWEVLKSEEMRGFVVGTCGKATGWVGGVVKGWRQDAGREEDQVRKANLGHPAEKREWGVRA